MFLQECVRTHALARSHGDVLTAASRVNHRRKIELLLESGIDKILKKMGEESA
jgi:phosphoribosyl-ATP pyrophosphohydrolase